MKKIIKASNTIRLISIFNSYIHTGQKGRDFVATSVIAATLACTTGNVLAVLVVFTRRPILEMKRVPHPGLLNETVERIREARPICFDHIAVSHLGARESQVTNARQHAIVAHELLMRTLPVGSSGIAAVVCIPRWQKVPNERRRRRFSNLALRGAVVVVGRLALVVGAEVLLEIGDVPKSKNILEADNIRKYTSGSGKS